MLTDQTNAPVTGKQWNTMTSPDMKAQPVSAIHVPTIVQVMLLVNTQKTWILVLFSTGKAMK